MTDTSGAAKPVAPVQLWAAISVAKRQQRSRYIHYWTIRRTRREAREAYLANWNPETKEALSWVTFERVLVTHLAAEDGA